MANTDPDSLPTRALSTQLEGLEQSSPIDELRATGPHGQAVTQVGRYVLLEELGRGAMGVVYTAYDATLDRRVAIKFVRSARTRSTEARQRLLREARAMARLSHAHVVHVYEADEAEGRVYIAMEFVEGTTLRRWVRGEPRPAWPEVVRVFGQIGEALAAAHDAGVVHRDFKPENVLLGPGHDPKVADFGLAGLAGVVVESGASSGSADSMPSGSVPRSGDEVGTLTETGTVMGTPAYMAPEQHLGEVAGPGSDQFSFCVALYEALYGQRPFPGGSLDEIREQVLAGVTAPPPKGAAVPGWLRSVALRGLSVDPSERYASMHAITRALRDDPRVRRRRIVTTVGAVAFGVAVTVAGSQAGDDADAPCLDASAQVQRMWDSGRRAAVGAGLRAVDRPFADDTAQRVDTQLDGYASRWETGWREACEATRVAKTQSEALLDKRVACLERRRRAFVALTDVLADADAGVLGEAVRAVSGLPRVAACADLDAVSAEVPPPDDPEVAARVEALDAAIAQAEAELMAGRLGPAHERATGIVEEAREVSYGPTRVAALLTLAMTQTHRSDYDAAVANLHEAFRAADEAGDDRARLTVALRLLLVTGAKQERFEVGEVWAQVALAAATRPTTSADDLARLHHQLGILRSQQGRYEDALAEYDEAGRLLDGIERDHRIERASLHNDRGVALNSMGRKEDALASFRAGVELWTTTLGPHHPDLANGHNNTGAALFTFGRYEEALDELQQGLQLRLDNFGPDNLAVARSRLNLGGVQIKLENFEAAESELEDARRIVEAQPDGGGLTLAGVLTNLGYVSTMRSRFEAASERYEAALAIRKRVQGVDHPETGTSHWNLAESLSAQEDDAGALEHYEEALRIRRAGLGEEHAKTVRAQWGLANFLFSRGRSTEALPYATAAMARIDADGVSELERAAAGVTAAQIRYALDEEPVAAREAVAAGRLRLGELEEDPRRLEELDAWLAAHP